jgi:hypothetical protein
MAAEQRRLLEQLMGEQLMNAGNTHKQAALQITDPKVCRSYLCGSCPHDLFTNTKQDLGPCPKAHLPNLKEEYQNASEQQKREWGFEFDYQRDIGRYVGDCDRRIDTAQRRLEKTAEEIRLTNQLLKQIEDFRRMIEAGIVEVEILAEGAKSRENMPPQMSLANTVVVSYASSFAHAAVKCHSGGYAGGAEAF